MILNMKNLRSCLVLIILLMVLRAPAQIISVAAGTNFVVKSGTQLGLDGLLLTPSADLSLADFSVSLSATLNHSTLNTAVARSYQFGTTIPVFSGDIQLFYQDGELNGLTESGLQLNVHNGSSWQNWSASSSDAVNNFITTNGLSSVSLAELTLADALQPLPLRWGGITAYRSGNQVKIDWTTLQESLVGHFQVERSTDAVTWKAVGNPVNAHNDGATHQYQLADPRPVAVKLYYRIREVDLDGGKHYSSIVVVAELAAGSVILIYPNPAGNHFQLGNVDLTTIRSVELMTISGQSLAIWKNGRPHYSLDKWPAGVYLVRVKLVNGTQSLKRLQLKNY